MIRILFVGAILWLGVAGMLSAQTIRPIVKKSPVIVTAQDRIRERLRKPLMSDSDFYGYMEEFRRRTDPSDRAIRRNVVQSAEGPFLSRRSVWADATIARRAAEFGAGPISKQSFEVPTLADRRMALDLPPDDPFDRKETAGLLGAVYRYLLGYRASGFASKATACFVGLGPHLIDPPAGVVEDLAADPGLQKEGVAVLPLSRALEVTAEALRDRDTGAYGAAFRVDDIGPTQPDGEVTVLVSLNERDGLWFSRDLTLRPGPQGWSIVADSDHVPR